MKAETTALAVKSVATGAAAAFGLTWWALAAAVIGAAASYHFERDQSPATVWRLVFGILAIGFTAVLLASASPSIPGLGWTGAILIEVRAGLLGLFANALVKLAKRLIAGWKASPEG